MTLIEVLIALFVFAIGALAIAAMTFMSIQGNALSNRMTQATLMVQGKVEELMTTQAFALAALGVEHSEINIDGNGDVGGNYLRKWVVTAEGPTAVSRWVRVEVSWVDAKGNHDVKVLSLMRVL